MSKRQRAVRASALSRAKCQTLAISGVFILLVIFLQDLLAFDSVRFVGRRNIVAALKDMRLSVHGREESSRRANGAAHPRGGPSATALGNRLQGNS